MSLFVAIFEYRSITPGSAMISDCYFCVVVVRALGNPRVLKE
jgi:hypothetical protein